VHRFSATTLVVVIVASLLVPLAISQAYHQGNPSPVDRGEGSPGSAVIEAVQFSTPIDTSATITEYPMISRALMLDGGSTDVAVADVNSDGNEDLVTSVVGLSRSISVFYGQSDKTWLSYPSYSISLGRTPVAVSVIDTLLDGDFKIAVLEAGSNDADPDRLVLFDVTADDSHVELVNLTLYENATSLVVADLVGDSRPDIAIASMGPNPMTSQGVIEIREGPSFSTYNVFSAGMGARSIVAGDFNDDASSDIAVANYHDSTVMVFHQPFSLGMSPSVVINVEGAPNSVASGRLNADETDDIAVVTTAPSAVRFFLQNTGEMPTIEDYNRTLDRAPACVESGDLDGDGRDDLLMLSQDDNVALGMLQRATSPIWRAIPDFEFPTGAIPHNSFIRDINGDAEVDVVIASARSDRSGSSVALYFSVPQHFCNSNLTVWTYPHYSATAMSVGDLDGDDWDDLVMLYPDLDGFGYSLSFSGSMTTIALGYEPALMLVEDFNGDGYDDVMTAGKSDAGFTVRFGGSVLPDGFVIRQYDCSHNATAACSGDLNDDGLLDLAISTDGGEIEVFQNSGDEDVFGEAMILAVSPGTPIASVAVGDFNSDGLDDIAFPKGIRTIGIVLQNPLSAEPISLPADLNLTASFDDVFDLVLSGDVTGDGKDDIVGARDGDSKLYLYDQNGFASHVPFDTLDLPESPGFVGLFDATDDGFVDVLAIFESADLAFLYRQEGGSLPSSPSMTFVTGALPCCAILADATQDHRGDLVVCNAGSHSVSAWEQINFPPTANAGGPYTAYQGDLFTFDGSSITGSSEVPYMEYRWDFDGDGSWDTEWARELRPVHTYMSLGEFDVAMEVRDPLGLNDTDYSTVNVVDSIPHVSFTIDPYPPVEGLTIHFNDTTTSYDPVTLMNWSVDGVLVSTGTESSIEAVFDDGPHNVSLEVVDSDGSVSNLTESFMVLTRAPEVFIASTSVVDEGSPVSFEVVVDDSLGGPWDPITSYEWNFSYEGEPFIADEVTDLNFTSHVFYAEGVSEEYTVAVRVTDTDGNSSIAIWELTVLDIGPDATVALSTPTPGEGVPFNFLAYDSPDGVVSWSWILTGPEGLIGAYSSTAAEMADIEFVLGDGDYSMSLVVLESDGDSDEFELEFSVAELPPDVALESSPAQAWYLEFDQITLSASVNSFDDPVLFEWDFMASGGEFIADSTTTESSTEHAYLWTGNYTAKVRVTDSDGSSTVAPVTIEIRDRDLEGAFDDVVVTRGDPPSSSTITFNASHFAYLYPDISNVLWEFGDGAETFRTGPPSGQVVHEYDPVADYEVNLTMTDDDGNLLRVTTVLSLVQPVIELISPSDGAVIVPGTSLRFSVSDDSIPLEYVRYSLNGGAPANFTTLYEIDTSGWSDGSYAIDVIAKDRDGNVALLEGIEVAIDSVAPVVWLSADPEVVYAGDRMNVTILVDDANIDPQSVVMYIRFPGDESPLSVFMKPLGDGLFYAVVQVPMRTGTISYWFEAEDLAGNSATSSSTYSVRVKMHFIDAAWPYLLILAVAAAFGTAAYFVRESKIAVDETFVIYNDGRLIAHSTRRLKPGMDDQILGSMFVAIQDFVKDSFKDDTSFTLRKLDFGDKSVLVERGESIFLAVVLHGKVSRKAARRMKRVVSEIEEGFSLELLGWDGDLDSVRGVNDIMKKLYSRAPAFPGSLK
jgi:PKD repeat protein